MFIRKIKTKSGTYLAEVETKRIDGKVKQRIIRYIGKEINGKISRKVQMEDVSVINVKRYLDVEIVDKLAEELGIKHTLPKEIIVFVYAQLLDRPEINKLEEWLNNTEILSFLGMNYISTTRLYEALSKFDEVDFRNIEEAIREKLLAYEKKSKAIILDVTDTYFEGKSVPGRPRKGKEDKVKKLLQISLAVTKQYGFPLLHRTYDGNISNIKVFQDMLPSLWALKYDPVIMDRRFLTEENLSDILSLKMKAIAGVKRNKYFQKHFLEDIQKDNVYQLENRAKLKNTQVYLKTFRYKKGKLLVVYNPALEALKRKRYYETHEKEGVAKYLGYSLIYHNTSMADDEVVKMYFDKDVVERAFRQMKGILSLRPVRVWLQSHIRSHVRICYMAYAILTLLSYKLRKLDISAPDALEKLKTGYKVYLKDEKTNLEWSKTVTPNKLQDKIICSVKKH
jgi:transposase